MKSWRDMEVELTLVDWIKKVFGIFSQLFKIAEFRGLWLWNLVDNSFRCFSIGQRAWLSFFLPPFLRPLFRFLSLLSTPLLNSLGNIFSPLFHAFQSFASQFSTCNIRYSPEWFEAPYLSPTKKSTMRISRSAKENNTPFNFSNRKREQEHSGIIT